MDYFEFEELMAAGVFELHSFPMPQIPGFTFSIRICENRHLALPDHISHYFSVQLCVKKGPRKSELKMRSELSDFQLEGTLNLTQNYGRWEPHCMRGVIFKPNVFEEQQEKITTELIEYGTYEYNPKTSRPAFNGWHFGTRKTNFTDYHNSHTGCPKKKFIIEFFEVRQLWALPGNFGHFWMLWTLLDIFGQSGHF